MTFKVQVAKGGFLCTPPWIRHCTTKSRNYNYQLHNDGSFYQATVYATRCSHKTIKWQDSLGTGTAALDLDL